MKFDKIHIRIQLVSTILLYRRKKIQVRLFSLAKSSFLTFICGIYEFNEQRFTLFFFFFQAKHVRTPNIGKKLCRLYFFFFISSIPTLLFGTCHTNHRHERICRIDIVYQFTVKIQSLYMSSTCGCLSWIDNSPNSVILLVDTHTFTYINVRNFHPCFYFRDTIHRPLSPLFSFN